MSEEKILAGQHILVVEDDYYLAMDTARALREAGAMVVGPCATEHDAREAIANIAITAAILDINLRNSRSFELAREFSSHGTPSIFITGYDLDVIPQEFKHIVHLQKPIDLRKMVSTLAAAIKR